MIKRGALMIAACWAAAGTAHAAAWSEPVPLAQPGLPGALTALPSGGFVATSHPSTGDGNLRLTTLDDAQKLDTDLTVPEGGARLEQATAGDGTTLVVTAGYDHGTTGGSLSLVVRAPDGSIGGPETFETGDRTGGLAVAGAPDGTLAVAWTAFPDEQILVRVRPPGGTFGATETVVDGSGRGGTRSWGELAMAFGPEGRLLVAALRDDEGARYGVVDLFERTPGSSAFSATAIGRYRSDQSGVADNRLALASGEAGTLVVWTALNEGGRYLRHLDLVARRRPAGQQEFAAVERLVRSNADASPTMDVTILPEGRAAVLMAVAPPRPPSYFGPMPPRRIVVAEGAAGLGAFDEATRVSRRQRGGSAVRDAANAALTADAAGNLLAAWTTTCEVCDSKVMAAVRPAGGSWSDAVAVNPAARYASAPAVALDHDGRGAIAWRDSERLIYPRRGLRSAVAVLADGIVATPPQNTDRRAPRILARIRAGLAEIIRRRVVPVRVRCTQSCYARVSYGGHGGELGSGADLFAGEHATIRVKLPRIAYRDARLFRQAARGVRRLKITASDGQGNLRQLRLALPSR